MMNITILRNVLFIFFLRLLFHVTQGKISSVFFVTPPGTPTVVHPLDYMREERDGAILEAARILNVCKLIITDY